MNKYALILGANSDIAEAISEELSKNRNYNLYLASRETEKLKLLASDLSIRNKIKTEVIYFDATNFKSHEIFFTSLNPKPDLVIVAFGYLGDQEVALKDTGEMRKIIDSNYTGAVSVLNIVAQHMRKEKKGTIVGISSVAGDRGRQSNYIYGSAKAGFTAYLSGLRNELYADKIHVLTVKPGFVRTKMIEGIDTPGFLTATAEKVAPKILKAIKTRKNILYVNGIWRYIMFIIRNIPEFLFKRMKL